MPRRFLAVCLGLLLAGCAGAARPRPVDLVAITDWPLVVDAAATPAEVYAAEEFRRLYALVSGAELGKDSAGEGAALPDGPVIRIGPGAAAAAGVVGDYGPEELHIRVDASGIVITGGRPRGTLYGVYTFFETYAGVRFLTAAHTHAPALGPARRVGPVDQRHAPALQWRYTYYGENHADHAFATRLRLNAVAKPKEAHLGGRSPRRLINHSVSRLLPWHVHGKEHPEYFCLRQGTRPQEVDRWRQTYQIQPCFSNPAARRILLANLRQQIEKEYLRWKDFSVSQGDNHNYCECPDCAALDEAAGSHAGQLLDCVNWIAAAIEKDYPDVTIGTLIYQWSRKPPQGVRPRANVRLQLCSIECCQIHAMDDPSCPLNTSFQEDFAGWSALTDNIAIWHYNVNFANYLVPCPNLFNLGRNVRYFVANHAQGIFMQCAGGTTGAEFSDLRNYVISNLLWDPTRSAADLREEFLTLHYGPAAPPVRRFIERVHTAARESGKHRACFGMAAEYGLDAELGAAGLADFREALALAPDEATRARLEKASLAAHRLRLEPLTEALVSGTGLDEAARAALRPAAKTFFGLCEKHGVKLVTERMSVEKAKVGIEALLDTPAPAASADDPYAPFAAASQALLELVQQGQKPFALTADVTLETEGRASAETGRLVIIRAAPDRFHLAVTHARLAAVLQRTPEHGFIHLPQKETLFWAEGTVPDGVPPFRPWGVLARAAALDGKVHAAWQLLQGINGAAAVALMRGFGVALERRPDAAGVAVYAIPRRGRDTGLVFEVDLQTRRFRRVRYADARLTVSVALTWKEGSALPPVPSPAKRVAVARGEWETSLRRGLYRALEVQHGRHLARPDVDREVRGPHGVHRVRQGQHIVVLRGTPQEIGRQHGRFLKDDVRKMVDSTLYLVGLAYSLNRGTWFLDEIRGAMARLDRHTPEEYLVELRGLADGADLPYEELHLASYFPEIFHCSGFALSRSATKDGVLLHGRILDYMTSVGLQESAVLMVVAKDGAIPFVSVSYAGFTGVVTGMNAKGVSLGEMGGRGEGKWDGIPMATLMRMGLERAGSLDEAKAIFAAGPRTCEYYYVFADGKDRSAVGVYATPETLEFIGPGERHPRLPTPAADCVLLSVGKRYKTLCERVQAAHGRIGPDEAMALMDAPVAMGGANLHSALMIPERGAIWVTHAGRHGPAYKGPVHKYDLDELLGLLEAE